MSTRVINVGAGTRLVLVDEQPVYVVTIRKDFDVALDQAQQWFGEPFETRSIEQGNVNPPWSPVRLGRDYFGGFKPLDVFDLAMDPWIVGVETVED